MTRGRWVGIGIATVVAAAALALLMHGVAEPGLRAVIRITARTSAVCVALAFARLAAREALIVLPVSHALHFAAILTLAATTTPANAHIGPTSVGGALIFALMIATALRPTTAGVYALWIVFVIGFVVRDMRQPVYPAIMIMLVTSAIVRASRRTTANVQRA